MENSSPRLWTPHRILASPEHPAIAREIAALEAAFSLSRRVLVELGLPQLREPRIEVRDLDQNTPTDPYRREVGAGGSPVAKGGDRDPRPRGKLLESLELHWHRILGTLGLLEEHEFEILGAERAASALPGIVPLREALAARRRDDLAVPRDAAPVVQTIRALVVGQLTDPLPARS